VSPRNQQVEAAASIVHELVRGITPGYQHCCESAGDEVLPPGVLNSTMHNALESGSELVWEAPDGWLRTEDAVCPDALQHHLLEQQEFDQ
jgi:hypothetical protein